MVRKWSDRQKKVRVALCFYLLTLLAISANASRTDGRWIQYRQPDGTELTVRFCGDEHYTYYMTTDGLLMNRDQKGFLRRISRESIDEKTALSKRSLRAEGGQSGRIKTDWNSLRIYKSPVILISYSNKPFTIAEPHDFYNSLFNENGFNLGVGKGCVADYFREQSGGKCNLQFDIYGPVFVPDTAGCYTNNGGSGKYRQVLRQALDKAVDSLGLDLSQYDWDDDGYVEQVVYVYAGYGGNDSRAPQYGYIHPHTAMISVYESNGVKANLYTCSAELWGGRNNRSCGIGTVCHEFSHALGLPDLYPTSGSEFSVIDEWDLMDGGNFSNWGWCPPNYSAMEKSILGWSSPMELTESTVITGMESVSDGGVVYKITQTEDEYFLLENRQQKGWDTALPGRGLAVFHVYYDSGKWHIGSDGGSNSVNSVSTRHCYDLVHADRRGYYDWRDLVEAKKVTYYRDNAERLNSSILSLSPYPLVTDTLVNREFTDTSVPAAVTYQDNAEGEKLLSKPVTNIQMTDDGLISFDFMGGMTGIKGLSRQTKTGEAIMYDLSGRMVRTPVPGHLYIVKEADGTVHKIIQGNGG